MKPPSISVSLHLGARISPGIRQSVMFRQIGWENTVAGATSCSLAGITEKQADRVRRWLTTHWIGLQVRSVRSFGAGLADGGWGAAGATPLGVLCSSYYLESSSTGDDELELDWLPTDDVICIADGRYILHDRVGSDLRQSGDLIRPVRVRGTPSRTWHEWRPGPVLSLLDGWTSYQGRWMRIHSSLPGASLESGAATGATPLTTSDGETWAPIVLSPSTADALRRLRGPKIVQPVFEPERWVVSFARQVLALQETSAP